MSFVFLSWGDRSRSRERVGSSWPTSRAEGTIGLNIYQRAPPPHIRRHIVTAISPQSGIKHPIIRHESHPAPFYRNVTVVTLTRAYFPFLVAWYCNDRVRNSIALYLVKSHRPLCTSNFLQHSSTKPRKSFKSTFVPIICSELFQVKSHTKDHAVGMFSARWRCSEKEGKSFKRLWRSLLLNRDSYWTEAVFWKLLDRRHLLDI